MVWGLSLPQMHMLSSLAAGSLPPWCFTYTPRAGERAS
jgi:hypothetical protein